MIEVGAEAKVEFFNDYVLKTRIEKKYRNSKLDKKIRRERNKKESRIMKKVLGRVNVPQIIDVGEFTIKMKRLKGKKLRDIKSLKGLEDKMGGLVASLHECGYFHGDLTTSNILLSEGNLFLIDFGLSDRGKIESFATDIKILFETIKATHSEFNENKFLQGYKQIKTNSDLILTRLKKVYERGRYRIKSSQ